MLSRFSNSNSFTNSGGAPAGYTGSPGDEQMTCMSCHGANTLSLVTPATLIINSDIEEFYVPDELSYFTISVTGVGVQQFGFQACFENEQGEKVGEIILVDPIQTQVIASGDYITHTSSGTTGMGAKTWGFYWKAPLTLQGEITLHTSVLLSNNNGVNIDDHVLFTSQSYSEPILGCIDDNALNFDEQASTDDGSCFFSAASFESSLSITYDSLTIHGTTFDEELEVSLNIHNNSDSDITVFASRNILSENAPTNWFCWDLCYFPTTDVSTFGVEIPAVSYTNEFSGHLVPSIYGGSYDIEYCFYSEMDYSDSICTTVHYVVEGEIPGCMDINAVNFSYDANYDDGSCLLYPQPNWGFSGNEDLSHSIVISVDTEIEINGESISNGDWIGVFYESEQGLVCASYTDWQGENVTIFAPGYDAVFAEGFSPSSELVWQVWDASTGVIWPMEVLYSSNFSDQGWFVENGQSSLLSMSNINPITEQTLEFPEGWSIFSSYMITGDMNIITTLESVVDHLIIVKNNEGFAYLIEYQFNAIGDLEIGQGYLVKTIQECTVTLEGAFAKAELYPVELQQGWNMIGYLKVEAELAEVVFADLVDQDAIQIVKDYQGSVYIPEWNFNGIGNLEPGKGYQVKTSQEAVLQY